MARVTGTVAVGQIVGKAGTAVFYRGRTGNCVRVRVTGTNPQTTLQSNARSYLTTASSTWSSLSSDQVAGWQRYAELVTRINDITGATYHPTAYTAFMALACKSQQINGSGVFLFTAPTTTMVRPSALYIAPEMTDTGTLTVYSPNSPTNISIEVVYQAIPTFNRTGSKTKWRSAGFHHFITGSHAYVVPTADLTANYFIFGYRFVNTATGEESPIFPFGTFTNI